MPIRVRQRSHLEVTRVHFQLDGEPEVVVGRGAEGAVQAGQSVAQSPGIILAANSNRVRRRSGSRARQEGRRPHAGLRVESAREAAGGRLGGGGNLVGSEVAVRGDAGNECNCCNKVETGKGTCGGSNWAQLVTGGSRSFLSCCMRYMAI